MREEMMRVGEAEARDFFAAVDDAPPLFLLQPGLGCIEYETPDEVVQFYQSVNHAYLAPEGRGQEICQGYIFCLRRGGEVTVYTALFGVQSGRVRIYLPDVAPEDDESHARVMAAAVAFGEQVGLIMEQERSGMSPEQRREWIRTCPVLKEKCR